MRKSAILNYGTTTKTTTAKAEWRCGCKVTLARSADDNVRDSTAPATWVYGNEIYEARHEDNSTARGVGTTGFSEQHSQSKDHPPFQFSLFPAVASLSSLSILLQPTIPKVFQTHANPSLLEWYLDTHHKFEYSSSSKSDYSIFGYFPQAFACWVYFNPKYSAKLTTNCGYSYLT